MTDAPTTEQKVSDYSGLPLDVSMVMLMGRLAGLLHPMRELEKIQLRANASRQSESTLNVIWHSQLALINQLRDLTEAVHALCVEQKRLEGLPATIASEQKEQS
jgi:hypothetical protein